MDTFCQTSILKKCAILSFCNITRITGGRLYDTIRPVLCIQRTPCQIPQNHCSLFVPVSRRGTKKPSGPIVCRQCGEPSKSPGVLSRKPDRGLPDKQPDPAVETLPDPVRKRLTLENDDRNYTPQDLFPVCRDLKIPLVYDVHHHRCLPDGLSVAAATEQSLETWDREPLFHISSPKDGWAAPDPKKHHDYIDIHDLPENWLSMDIIVEIEAKAKELAIKKVMADLQMVQLHPS
jgi:hypothetical protein